MTGLKQRLFPRRASGSPRSGDGGRKSRLPFGSKGAKRKPWGKRAQLQPALTPAAGGASTTQVVETAGSASFRDRGKLRRRLQYLRRARELAFRDVGGLIFDMRRFGRDRPDLIEAKISALAAVDQELRALERVLDDRRPIHELHEPGLSSCARCGALHASEDNFCPRCGLQIGGPQAMGEVGGAIAAPPQAPAAPLEQGTAATMIAPALPPHDPGAWGAPQAGGAPIAYAPSTARAPLYAHQAPTPQPPAPAPAQPATAPSAPTPDAAPSSLQADAAPASTAPSAAEVGAAAAPAPDTVAPTPADAGAAAAPAPDTGAPAPADAGAAAPDTGAPTAADAGAAAAPAPDTAAPTPAEAGAAAAPAPDSAPPASEDRSEPEYPADAQRTEIYRPPDAP